MDFQAYTLSKYSEWACIQIKAHELPNRIPIHLCCVIDTSGSMITNSKLQNVKKSLHFLLDFLTSQDSLTIITFSNSAKVVVSNMYVTPLNKESIRTQISFMTPDDSTNMSAGIIEAAKTLKNDINIKQSILLLTDGIANVGLIRPEEIIELVRNTMNKSVGTSISTIGYGNDHHNELLQKISVTGGGSYYVVNTLEDTATVFGNILGGLISCIAQQVKVVLPADTIIKSRYDSNITNDDNKNVQVLIGDCPGGSESIFLAKLAVGQKFNIEGYNLISNASFAQTVEVKHTDDSTIQLNNELHYHRFEVLELLEESHRLMKDRNNAALLVEQVDKINKCIDRITAYKTVNENILWNILLGELVECKRILQSNDRHSIVSPLTQMAGYIGCMRGLPSATASMTQQHTPMRNARRQLYYDDEDMESAAPDPVNITPIFSNSLQQRISSQLCTNIQNSQEATLYSGITSTIQQPTYSQEPPASLPIPLTPASRQVACRNSSNASSEFTPTPITQAALRNISTS